ncbi:SdpI family protein [Treponema brennaborense]|uniref:Uncharacterized protein n=1 Tax=Treponema brennaborense (strain DSM 12168 / CIP 105900 / DD5/3) TaxID=906968 RepID=F4LPX2_TREBD|nr:SdpI family protein [Treponema brennaborense]AEE16064.1 hypothetical protein Trebr_0622 [Treponema brennaborense DSM 12168]
MSKEIIMCCALALGGIMLLWNAFLILVKKEKIGLSAFETDDGALNFDNAANTDGALNADRSSYADRTLYADRGAVFKRNALRLCGKLFAAAGTLLIAAGAVCLLFPAVCKLAAVVCLGVIFAVMAACALLIKTARTS